MATTNSIFKDSNELHSLITATVAKYPTANEAYGSDSIVMYIKLVFKNYTTAQLQNIPFMKKIFLSIFKNPNSNSIF